MIGVLRTFMKVRANAEHSPKDPTMNRRDATLSTLATAMTWSAARAQTAPQASATYSNPQLGVAFKHPAGMKVSTYQAGQKRVAEFLAMEPYAQVNFEVSLNATGRNLADYISAYLRVFKAQTSAVMVGGVAAVKGVIAYPNPGNSYFFTAPGARAPVFSLGFMGDTAGLERALLDSVRFSKPDGSFVASGNYPDYGATFGSDDSEAGKALRRALGIK